VNRRPCWTSRTIPPSGELVVRTCSWTRSRMPSSCFEQKRREASNLPRSENARNMRFCPESGRDASQIEKRERYPRGASRANKREVSANRTSQPANESGHPAHNLRLHAIAQTHGPFETIRKGRND
jgi:hypothetical protein